MRRLPPWSDPVASGAMPHDSATAEPPELPPQVSDGLNGLPVAPNSRLTVLAPMLSSGVFVLPMMTRTRPP